VRSRDTRPELLVRRLVRELEYSHRVCDRTLPATGHCAPGPQDADFRVGLFLAHAHLRKVQDSQNTGFPKHGARTGLRSLRAIALATYPPSVGYASSAGAFSRSGNVTRSTINGCGTIWRLGLNAVRTFFDVGDLLEGVFVAGGSWLPGGGDRACRNKPAKCPLRSSNPRRPDGARGGVGRPFSSKPLRLSRR
jgi:hypothetical protein